MRHERMLINAFPLHLFTDGFSYVIYVFSKWIIIISSDKQSLLFIGAIAPYGSWAFWRIFSQASFSAKGRLSARKANILKKIKDL